MKTIKRMSMLGESKNLLKKLFEETSDSAQSLRSSRIITDLGDLHSQRRHNQTLIHKNRLYLLDIIQHRHHEF